MAEETKVFIVGATGMLGSQIAQRLVERGARVRALVRPSAGSEKRGRLTALGEQVEIVDGDLTRMSTDDLAMLVDGAEVVVSAVQGGPDIVTDGQTKLVEAAGKAGVERMIPSDFALDLHKLDYGDNVFLDHRKRADEAFASTSVKPVYVLTGAFMEVMVAPFLEIVDFDAGTFSFYGDPDQPMDFTTVADTAAYAAAVALDRDIAGRKFAAAGDVLSMSGFRAAVEAGASVQLEPRRLGSADDLLAEVERRRAAGKEVPEYVALQYQWAMVTGKGKLSNLENDRFPEIEPVSMKDFVAAQISVPSA